jgi:hypothetical protein
LEESGPDIEPPSAGWHLWEWFWTQLHPRRRSGPEALSWGELDSWSRMIGIRIEPEEAQMLMAMDDAYLRETREEQKNLRERMKEKSKATKGQ